jgi:hypothetical protein
VACEMADYSAIMWHFDVRKLSYYTYHPKSLMLMKAVICHFPGDTPVEDITNELVVLSFSVINVRQMSASRPQPQGGSQLINFPLFIVTLTVTSRQTFLSLIP